MFRDSVDPLSCFSSCGSEQRAKICRRRTNLACTPEVGAQQTCREIIFIKKDEEGKNVDNSTFLQKHFSELHLEADGGSVELRALCFNRPRVSYCCASPTEYTGVCFVWSYSTR